MRYIDIHQCQIDNQPQPFNFDQDVNSYLCDLLKEDMIVPDPNFFLAGNLHRNASQWQYIISDPGNSALGWINNKVDIHDFMQPFKGKFWGIEYDHSYPPPRRFNNASNCGKFVDFINAELISRLKSGAVSYLGRVGEIEPPYIVSPITVEPTKPRLCINLMYLNCFMKDTPFSLDTLVNVPHIIKKCSYMTKLDDKSGYDHVFMSESSKKLLGFQWGGHYFCCNSLVFGWKNSAYVYHTLNLEAMSYLRKLTISGLIYIDDRLLEEYNGTVPITLDTPYMRSCIALRLSVKLLVSLGYFLGVPKCVFVPTQCIIFLGMIINSIECSFFITDKRKDKFLSLQALILNKQSVSLSTIQQFTGMCVSMAMAIPAAKLYTACCNRAISKACSNNSLIVKLDKSLREEITFWEFLKNWNEPYPWLLERHYTLTISSDSSDYKWGAVYLENGGQITFSDYWSNDQLQLPIMLKEALALKNALLCLAEKIKGQRILAQVDNKAVVYAWENQYSKCSALNVIMKDIFQIIFSSKCSLSLSYIPTNENPSDVSSRHLSKSDATLTQRAWGFIQLLYGPHTIDMFALDSNSMTDQQGHVLTHFTPYPTPLSGGVDAFAQTYSDQENYYAFPPFCLLPAIVKFIIQEQITCTLLLPEIHPCPPWITLTTRYASSIRPVGYIHDKGVLLYPSKRGFVKDKLGLKCNILAARFAPGHADRFLHADGVPNTVFIRPSNHAPVLILSDSMLRFLDGRFEGVRVVSLGGATLANITNILQSEVLEAQAFVVIIHAGTNNINKAFSLEHESLEEANKSLHSMCVSLKRLQKLDAFIVVISSCIYTQSTYINGRVDKFNSWMKQECDQFDFHFLDNSNINSTQLRDFVHLNYVGEELLVGNLQKFL